MSKRLLIASILIFTAGLLFAISVNHRVLWLLGSKEPRSHTAVLFGPDIVYAEAEWRYEGVVVFWQRTPHFSGEEGDKVAKDGEWTCFRVAIVSDDPLQVDYWLVSHGAKSEVCFKNLDITAWQGPTGQPKPPGW